MILSQGERAHFSNLRACVNIISSRYIYVQILQMLICKLPILAKKPLNFNCADIEPIVCLHLTRNTITLFLYGTMLRRSNRKQQCCPSWGGGEVRCSDLVGIFLNYKIFRNHLRNPRLIVYAQNKPSFSKP